VLWLWILLGLAAVVVLLFVLGYNRLVRLRNEVDTGWSNIDVQLQRRGDLIPNLVEAVRAYAAHERAVFESVTEARAALQRASGPAEAADANDVLTSALGRLFAVAEAYPDLKANTTMLQLQEELTSTENRVAFARQAYNDAVMNYNTQRESFPTNMIAGPFNFQPAESFVIERPQEKEAPKVTF